MKENLKNIEQKKIIEKVAPVIDSVPKSSRSRNYSKVFPSELFPNCMHHPWHSFNENFKCFIVGGCLVIIIYACNWYIVVAFCTNEMTTPSQLRMSLIVLESWNRHVLQIDVQVIVNVENRSIIKYEADLLIPVVSWFNVQIILASSTCLSLFITVRLDVTCVLSTNCIIVMVEKFQIEKKYSEIFECIWHMPTRLHCWKKKNSGAQWARTSNLLITVQTRSKLSYIGRYVEWYLNFY